MHGGTFTYKFKRGKLADLVSLLSGRVLRHENLKLKLKKTLSFKLHDAVLHTINKTNYERFLMIIESAGIVKSSLIRSQNALNFSYALYLALRERKIKDNIIEKIVRVGLCFRS